MKSKGNKNLNTQHCSPQTEHLANGSLMAAHLPKKPQTDKKTTSLVNRCNKKSQPETRKQDLIGKERRSIVNGKSCRQTKAPVANGLEQIAEDAEKPLLKAKQVLTQRQTIISPNTAGLTSLHCHLVCIQVLNQTWLQVLSASWIPPLWSSIIITAKKQKAKGKQIETYYEALVFVPRWKQSCFLGFCERFPSEGTLETFKEPAGLFMICKSQRDGCSGSMRLRPAGSSSVCVCAWFVQETAERNALSSPDECTAFRPSGETHRPPGGARRHQPNKWIAK